MIKAAGIIPYIIEDGELKFLLIKNNIGWEFPKGRIERDESPLVAAKRETKEETGLIIDEVYPYFVHESKYFLTKDYATGKKLENPIPKTVTYFLGKATTTDIELSFEHDVAGWFTPPHAMKKLRFSSKREVLQHALNALSRLKI